MPPSGGFLLRCIMYKFGKIDETVITIFRVLNDKGNGFYRDGFDSYFPRPSTWWEKMIFKKKNNLMLI